MTWKMRNDRDMRGPILELTDEQWEKVKQVLPNKAIGSLGGRPPLADRRCFEGILWILLNGAPWRDLPACYGSRFSVRRRLIQWTTAGVWLKMFHAFVNELDRDQKPVWLEVLRRSSVPRARRLPLAVKAFPANQRVV